MNESQPAPKRRSPSDRLLDILFREPPFGQPNCECCVEFLEAKRRIEALSSGAYQWTVLPVTGLSFTDPRWSSRYAIICFSNPDPTGIPNHICYCIPLFPDRTGPRGIAKLLACFATRSIIPLSGALHWEEDELDMDDFKDWLVFWGPINQCFWPLDLSPESESPATPGERQSEMPSATITGVSWRDSVEELARHWTESQEAVMKKILL